MATRRNTHQESLKNKDSTLILIQASWKRVQILICTFAIMNKLILTALACVALASLSSGATEEPSSPARILVEKKILNTYLVESRDIVVNYKIFNVGGSPAVDVTISDASLPTDHFETVGGVTKFTIPTLAPGSNTSHSVVYRPKVGVWGRYNFTSADVSYLAGEGAKEANVGYTSEPGEGFIVSSKDFNKKFNVRYYEWIAFVFMCLPSILIPYILWNKSRSKFEAISKAAKRQ
ncbi:Translocon-associated protein subunit beta [Halotydeus destructor]|nr:Translocon-associated protein subunit beta [Halotydeus destructor]